MVKASHGPESDEPRWSDIGSKLESDVRGVIAGIVGTKEDADWQTIGNQVVDKVREAWEKMRGDKGEPVEPEHPRAVKIEITTEEGSADQPPAVKSSDPVDPAI
jgi:hypothetical protein